MEAQPEMIYFRISDGSDNVVYDQQNEGFNSEKAMAEVKRFFDNNEGVYSIVLRNKRTKVGNGYREMGTYTVFNTREVPVQKEIAMNGFDNQVNNGAFGGSSDIQSLIAQMQKKDERIQELIQSNFLALMDEKNKQFDLKLEMLKKETANPNSAFDQAALTALTGLFGGGGGVNINGLGDAPVMENETTKRLNTAITKLLKLDYNFVANLEKLCKLAEEKPTLYKMAVTQLMNL
jgi:hypothetical protein